VSCAKITQGSSANDSSALLETFQWKENDADTRAGLEQAPSQAHAG